MDHGLNEYVVCQLCGREYKQITETHLLKHHNILFSDYKKMFPDSETLIKSCRDSISENAQKLIQIGIIGFHEGHKVNQGKVPWNKDKHGCQTSWRKGLTKESSASIRLAAEQCSMTRKKMYREGKLKKKFGKDNPMYGAKLSNAHKIALLKGNTSYNSKPELKLWNELQKISGWEYSAKTKFFISTEERVKNPDFVNRSSKKVIEVFGNYWHRNEDPQELIDFYKSTGWDCIVLWELEIMNKEFSIGSLSDFLGGNINESA